MTPTLLNQQPARNKTGGHKAYTTITLWALAVAGVVFLGLAMIATKALAAGAGPTIAIGEITAPVDLNNPQNVTARIKRLAQDSGHGALEKFVHGTVKVSPGAGDSPDVSIEWFGLSSDAQGGD